MIVYTFHTERHVDQVCQVCPAYIKRFTSVNEKYQFDYLTEILVHKPYR